MPVTGVRSEFEMATRNDFTKVKCEIGIKIDGRELPNVAVVGAALDAAVEAARKVVNDSYRTVPERL